MAIKLSNVSKDYGESNIKFKDLVFNDNESYVILGPSGCGKSTLLNMISGSLKTTSGNIIVYKNEEKLDINALSSKEVLKYRRENIVYVTQDFKIFENFTVGDNLNLVREITGKNEDINRVLQEVGLKEKKKSLVKNLSGGEKQRVIIARAMLLAGNIILCDEPTASLNYNLAENIIKLIIKFHKKSNSTLIVVTHDDRLIKHFDNVLYREDIIRGEKSCLNMQ